MKKFKVMFLMLILILALSGCKNEEETPVVDDVPDNVPVEVEATPRTQLKELETEYEMDTELLPADLVEVLPDFVESYTKSVFLDDNGIVLDSIKIVEGENKYTIISQFFDGVNDELELNITGVKPKSKLPEDVAYRFETNRVFNDYGLSYVEMPGYTVEPALANMYDDFSVVKQVCSYVSDVNGYDISISKLDVKDENLYETKGESLFMLDLTSFLTSLIEPESLAAVYAEDAEADSKIESAIFDLVNNNLSGVMDSTSIPSKIYDLEGNEYIGKVYKKVINFKFLGTDYKKVPVSCYQVFDINDDKYIVEYILSDADDLLAGIDLDTFEKIKVDNAILTEDGIKAFLGKVFESEVMDAQMLFANTPIKGDPVKDITGYVVYGTIASDDIPGRGDNQYPDLYETSDDVAELMKDSYFSKYASTGIWNWPENDTKCRRWVYTIDSDTTFSSFIIFPDGTSLKSRMKPEDETVNEPDPISIGDGTGVSGGDVNFDVVKHELIGSYYKFIFNTGKTEIGQVNLNKVKSTSTSMEVTFKDKIYTIDVIDADMLTEYVFSNNVYWYDTSDISGDLSISKGTAVMLGDNTLLNYTLTYYSGTEDKYVTVDYCSVIVTDSDDCIIIHKDGIPTEDMHMKELLKTIFSRNEKIQTEE